MQLRAGLICTELISAQGVLCTYMRATAVGAQTQLRIEAAAERREGEMRALCSGLGLEAEAGWETPTSEKKNTQSQCVKLKL